MPLFIHRQTRELHPDTIELIEQVACLVAEKGIDAWFDLAPETLLGRQAQEYEKLTDTLDVWFDSGVSHFSVLKQRRELGYPADVYMEGSDQYRGWFNSSLTTAVAVDGCAPYKSVLTHGFTVDAEGKKLSKSKGNYVALDKLIADHGADILRLWVCSADFHQEVSISDEIIRRISDAYRRIRNTARFLLSNLFDFDPNAHALTGDNLVKLDAWAIHRTRQLQDEITQAYEAFEFHGVYQKIHNFCSLDLGSFYLDIIKDRQYTLPENAKARRSCQTAMYHIIGCLSRWLAPVLSFTAEEIWEHIPGTPATSVFLQQWSEDLPEVGTLDMAAWQTLQDVRAEVNKALEIQRKSGVIGSGLAANVTLYADDNILETLNSLGSELRFLLITSAAEVKPLAEAPEQDFKADELGVIINVAANEAPKCSRCWHRQDSVGASSEHPELCQRCVDNVSYHEESRTWV